MKKNQRHIARIIAILFLLGPVPMSKLRSAPAPNPDQTILEVRHAGAQTTWGTSRTIHALNTLTFRWQTDVPMTNFGQWQLLDYPPPPNDLMAQPFAVSDPNQPLPVPPAGQFTQFTLDFAQLQQQHPGKIPANAPAQAKEYYLRLVPWKTMDMTNPANVAGQISINVKITYVKSPPAPPDPPKIKYVFTWLHGHYIALDYVATKPVIPVVTVSTSAPGKDAKGNPEFKNQIVSSAFPLLSGYDADGGVTLKNLKPKTHYYFIIMAKDEKGGVDYKTGEFTTATRFAEVFFEKIYMIDDSDGFPSGGGDMTFAFFVNDMNALGTNKTIPQKGSMTFSTGETKSFNILKTIEDPPGTVKVKVNGYDDDDCAIFTIHPFCDCEPPGDVRNPDMKNFHCKDGSGEDATDSHFFNVAKRTGLDEEYTEKAELLADNGALKFRPFVSITVRYRGGIPYVNK